MSMRKRKKVQILSREELRLRRWNFGLVPSERSLEAVGKSVRLHIIGRSNVFDLFPRTYKGKKRCVLRQKTRFDKFPRTNANLATHLTSIWSNRATARPSSTLGATSRLIIAQKIIGKSSVASGGLRGIRRLIVCRL